MKLAHLSIKSTILVLTLIFCSLALFAGVLTDSRYQFATSGLGTQINGLLSGLTTRLPFGTLPTATPTIVTDRTGYFAGSTVQIAGSGYLAGQVVTLQVVHADGTAEAGGGHEAFTVAADELGRFTATWTLGRDPNGHFYTLFADTVPSGEFNRIASVKPDKFDYQPGETAQLTGKGFNPGETVNIQVVHSNGLNGNGHEPFNAVADQEGNFQTSWFVDPDDSLHSLFRLTAQGASSGLLTTATFNDAAITVVDDKGADDFSGQKDLNFLTVDYALGTGLLGVAWGWDDTAWSGGNTGDACALFDTDGDGNANYSMCVVVHGVPAHFVERRLYSCGDSRVDRCDQPITLITTATSTAYADVDPGADPYGVTSSPYYNANHVSGNTCKDTPGCYTDDTVANLTVHLSDFGGYEAKLTNVCSYPSQEPNSDPSECVITPNSGFLTVVKVADPNETTQFPFSASTASQGGVSNWSITGSGSVQLISYAPTTTLDLTETVPSSWKLDSASCVIQTATPTSTGTPTATGIDNLEIRSGLETICTFNDSLAQGSLQIVKRVVNDNGGTADYSAFGLTTDAGTLSFGTGVADGTNILKYTSQKISVDTGSYTLREDDINGYTEGTWSCTGATPSDNTISAGAVTVPAGTDVVCTITNDDVAPQLTLNKHVVNDNGGTANASAWTLTATGSSGGFSGAGSPATGSDAALGPNDVTAGVEYTLSESGGPSGYTSTGIWSCTGGGTFTSPNKITLAVGETASCTITNNDATAQLTVIKHVINDNGGNAVAGNFTMNITGTNVSSASFPGAESPGTTVTLDAGTYSVDESAFTGYTKTIGTDCSGTIAVGESKTCTITNDDIAPKLTLTKVVQNNNGGGAGPNDFGISVGGATVTSGVKNTYQANTPLAINETGHTGYSFVSITGDAKCPSVLGGTVTLDEGDDVSCTITNDDIAPKLKLVKTVVNDNGGTLTDSDFARFIDGSPVSWNVSVELLAGSHTASETQHAGYAASSWGGDCAADGTITLAPGDDKTCTITNDDIAPKLKLVKTVTNNNGGTALANDWDLIASGDGGFTELNPGSATFHEVKAGINYGLSEQNGPSGYEMGGFVCMGFQTLNKLTNGIPVNTVTLQPGDEVTCTVNNDDIAPTLTLVKTVVNDNGGSLTEADFPSFIDSSPVSWGAANTISAGSHTASETSHSGYTASAWGGDCAADGTINLLPGENKTCTITNDDQQAYITVVKVVHNEHGGTAQPDNFNLTLDGGAASSGVAIPVNPGSHTAAETLLSGYTFDGFSGDCDSNGKITIALGESKTCMLTNSDQQAYITVVKVVNNNFGGLAKPNDFLLKLEGASVSSGVAVPVNPGNYTASETLLDGYAFDGFSGGCDSNGSVTVALGESKTCTLTNSDVQPKLIVIKHVINDNGGTATAADFTLDSGGINDSPDNFPGEESPGTTVNLNVGAYDVTETGPLGYTAEFSADCSGSIAVGEVKTCTVTNDDNAPSLTLVKQVVKDNGGTALPSAWTLAAAGPTGFSGVGPTVNNGASFDAGTYNLSETGGPVGYAMTSLTCSNSGATQVTQVTVGLGESVTCTFVNDDISPTLTVIKQIVPDTDPGLFNLQIDSVTLKTDASDGDSTGAVPVTAVVQHTVGEIAGTGTTLSDYDAVISGDCAADGTITLALAQNKTCTITNTRRGKTTLLKLTDGVENPSMIWNFSLTGPGVSATDSTPPPAVDFGGVTLKPGATYTMCETGIPGAWTVEWRVDSNGDGTPDLVIPFAPGVNDSAVGPDGYSNVYDPNYVAPPASYTNDTRCVKFTVSPGETLAFQINNAYPGGEPRTIGFWKNWNTCTGGRQDEVAEQNGGPDAGWFILDDLLNNPGYHLGPILPGGLQLDGDDSNPLLTYSLKNRLTNFPGTDCQAAVLILDKSDVVTGKKKASDPAYNLAAQLLAAELNLSAGAETCPAVQSAVTQAVNLLIAMNFNGTGDYGKKAAQANQANQLAKTLDLYNNGFLCP